MLGISYSERNIYEKTQTKDNDTQYPKDLWLLLNKNDAESYD